MEKFTKGPWQVVKVWKGFEICPVANNGQYLVALVNNAGNENNEANANLIAAAPDIYESLRQMIDRFDSDTAKMCDDITDETTVGAMIRYSVERREDWVRPHRAALAKARGEKP